MPSPFTVALEGMPGCGKTSSMVSLTLQFGQACLGLSELNLGYAGSPLPQPGRDHWRPFHAMWQERLALFRRLNGDISLIILDRCHFSTLAVAFALDFSGSDGGYTDALAASQDDAIVYDLVAILDADPCTGLHRRMREHFVPPPWDNPVFLSGLRMFYQDELPRLCQGRCLWIDTSATLPGQVDGQLSNALRGFGAREGPRHTRPTRADELRLLMAGRELGLGRPYGHAVHVFDYPTLYFRQHSLQLDPAGPILFHSPRLKQLLDRRTAHLRPGS